MVKWTDEQEDAIFTANSDVLVAAAAGSGKTAVLVERIIQKLVNPTQAIDIDTMLVVTFTNAAAREMRNRVGAALEKALDANPSSNHLKKQLSLLQKAPIQTLHSFCLDLVKQYAYLLDIDPAFRIADQMEADLMKQDVMDELLEEWYGQSGDTKEAFFAVVDRFSGDRSDVDVENLIFDLYRFATTNPSPKTWLDEIVNVYRIEEDVKEEEINWLTNIKEELAVTFKAIEDELERAMAIARESDGPYQYIETIEKDQKLLKEGQTLLSDWNGLQTFIQEAKFARLSSKKTECNEDKKEIVKAIRNDYKEIWDKLKKTWFTRSLNAHLEDMRELAPIVEHLANLVKQFMDRFALAKKEKALVDFADLEHFCLQILVDETSTPKQAIPSEIAQQLKGYYHEILVDEYQDSATRC